MASLATVVGGADNAWAQVGVDDLGKFVLLQVTGVLQGLAFGLLFLNSSAAIVSYFVLPIALNIVATLWSSMAKVSLDRPVGCADPLFRGGNLTGEQWASASPAR